MHYDKTITLNTSGSMWTGSVIIHKIVHAPKFIQSRLETIDRSADRPTTTLSGKLFHTDFQFILRSISLGTNLAYINCLWFQHQIKTLY